MKPYVSSLANAAVLIIFGLWGYFDSNVHTASEFLPVVFGVLFLALNKGLRKKNKTAVFIVVLLTLLVFIELVKPLTGVIWRDDSMAIFRILTMMVASLWAIMIFIKSFIDASVKERFG